MAATASWTFIVLAKPVHHMTGVSSMAAAQTEVGRAPYSHVTDGTLKSQTFTDGTLSPAGLTATVAAVNAELCEEHRHQDQINQSQK